MANILQKIDPEYKVIGTAADGEAGYELIKRTKPDLVIMDIRMPKTGDRPWRRELPVKTDQDPGIKAGTAKDCG